MAAPTIPVSARGVSITRSGPKRLNRPSVTRNTPPSFPTSSPRITTSLSRSISSRNARFKAWTVFIIAISEILELPRLLLREAGKGVSEHIPWIRRSNGVSFLLGLVNGDLRTRFHVFLVYFGPEAFFLHEYPQTKDGIPRFP